MDRVKTLTEEKSSLIARVNELELQLEESQLNKDAKYLALKTKHKNSVKEIEELKAVWTSDENPESYTSEQLSLMIRNFKSLKEEIRVLKSNNEKYAKEWVRDLDQSSGHYLEVNSLKGKYEELSRKYAELDLKITQEGEAKFQEQVKQREDIIKSQAEYILKILWESHKLREYIRQELNVVVHPVDFNIFRI